MDLCRFNAWASHLLYVLQPLPLPAQSQQRHGILFHTTSSSMTQLDLKLFLFLRLQSVEAGGLQLRNKKHIQCNGAGLSLDSQLLWPGGLGTVCAEWIIRLCIQCISSCANVEHDEWAEWSVKAVFSLITIRCLIRARICAPSLWLEESCDSRTSKDEP